jgi:hypothetical protein
VCILYRRQESILRFNLKYGAGKEEKKMAYEAKKQSSETSRHRNYNKIKNYASPARKTPFHLLPARSFRCAAAYTLWLSRKRGGA